MVLERRAEEERADLRLRDMRKESHMVKIVTGLAAAALLAQGAFAQIRITEWMYQSNVGPSEAEYFELTNLGGAPIDLTGWSYADDAAIPGLFDLSPLGTINPFESVVITETDAEDFRARWNLPASIKILGNLEPNLGRNDEINIYNNAFELVDRLDFGDQEFPGTIRTRQFAGVPLTLDALGADNPFLWDFAQSIPGGGVYDLSGIAGPTGVLTSIYGETGNPGYFVPTPGAAALLAIAAIGATRRRRA